MRWSQSSLAFASALVLSSSAFAQQTPPPPGTTVPPAQSQTAGSSPLNQVEDDIGAGKFADAEGLLNTYLSAHPSDDRALFDLGYCEDAQGHTDQAAADFQKAIQINPKQFESHLALGLLMARQGNSEAEQQLQDATRSEPNPPNPAAKAQAYRALARVEAKSNPNAASDALIAALHLTPETPSDTLLAGQIAESAGSYDIAEQAYRRVLAANPSNPDAIAGLTHLLMIEKKYSDAEPMVRAALGRDPDDPTLNAELAAILSAEGKPQEAITALEKLHQAEPNNVNVANMLADAYLQSGELEKAAALYPSLIRQQPNRADLLDSYGQILIRQKNYPAAIADFQQALKINPSDIDAWSGVAFASSETHQYQQEIEALEHRAQLTPDTPATLFLWATAYDHLRETKKAVDYYHRFLAAANGKFPDQEWEAKHRLVALPR